MKEAMKLFKKRSEEINFYYDTLLDIESGNLNIKTSDNTKFSKILKSNFLLMLYNFIEACIREGFDEVYKHINNRKISYSDLIEHIQQIWSNYEITPSAHKTDTTKAETYQKRMDYILQSATTKKEIELSEKYLALRGNLDARYIRELLNKHNIPITDKRDKNKINTIKLIRNELAHGRISFIEGARDLSILDLKEFKDEVFDFIESVLDSMMIYCRDENFLTK